MKTVDEIQIALIEHLKNDAALVTLLGTPDQIKEVEWQGAEFVYPAVRVENTVRPNKAYCSPDDVDIAIFCLDEKKSSKRCSQVAAEVAKYLHGHPFKGTNGVSFIFLRVTSITYPKQQEGHAIWTSPVEVTAQVK